LARNAVIDYYRAHALVVITRTSLTPIRSRAQRLMRTTPPQPPASFSPCVLRMVGATPEPYREALKLADFEGLQPAGDRRRARASRCPCAKVPASSGSRQQLREMLLDCGRVERDRRGNVIDFETTGPLRSLLRRLRGKAAVRRVDFLRLFIPLSVYRGDGRDRRGQQDAMTMTRLRK
jgi:hypothetical protein